MNKNKMINIMMITITIMIMMGMTMQDMITQDIPMEKKKEQKKIQILMMMVLIQQLGTQMVIINYFNFLAKKSNRGEKKFKKAMQKLGMKPITGINRVTIKKGKTVLLYIDDPEILKSPTADNSYIV